VSKFYKTIQKPLVKNVRRKTMSNLIKISDKGLVSARELYLGLGLNKAHWSRWYPTNIQKNEFFEGNADWTALTIMENGNETMDFAVTIEFAKHIAMMARTEKSHEYRNYFIKCEDKLKEQNKPVCIEDVLIQSLQEMKDVKLQLQEVKQSTADNKQEIQGIRDVVALNPNQWRKDTAELINKMAVSIGGFEHIKPIREESYKMLNENMGVCLKTRVLNKKKKMALEGTPKYKIDKINPLDAIADDKKLINGYVSIITKLAIKYKVA
jgi:anti-repressor protein